MKEALKRAVPPAIHDFLRSMRDDRKILALPDRRFVEERLIPAIGASGAREVLFVGVRSYTSGYPELFRQAGVTLWTTDIDPVAARHGAKGRHVTCDVLKLTREHFPVAFDLIVFSGVIGFGVNSPEQIEAAAHAVAGLVAPGRPVVLGWNHDNAPDPLAGEGAWTQRFERSALPGIDQRVTFEGATHVFDVLKTR